MKKIFNLVETCIRVVTIVETYRKLKAFNLSNSFGKIVFGFKFEGKIREVKKRT